MTDSKAVLSIQEQLKKDLARADKAVAPPSGHQILTQNKEFTFPDGTQTDKPINVVILDWRISHSYYTGAWDPKKPEPPVCWAIGDDYHSLAPSEHAPEPQANFCHECPLNEFGSHPTNKNAKACKNTRRLAVVPPDADDETPVWTLTVSPTGLSSFDKMVRELKNRLGMIPIQVVAEVSFNPNVHYPSLRFSAVGPHENLELFYGLKEKAQPLLDREPISE